MRASTFGILGYSWEKFPEPVLTLSYYNPILRPPGPLNVFAQFSSSGSFVFALNAWDGWSAAGLIERPQFELYLSQIAKCICLKFLNVFVSNHEMYLSQIMKCICLKS